MNQEDAVKIFQLDDSFEQDDVQDAYENSFFSTRDYFLKNTVVPQLFLSRLQRLKKFEEAFCLLTDQVFEWRAPSLSTQPNFTHAAKILELQEYYMEALLRTYEAKLTEKRMFLAQSWTIPEVVRNTLQVIGVQQAYQTLFEEFAMKELSKSKLDDEDVKVSQQVDSGLLLKLLKERGNSSDAEKEFQEFCSKELARVKKLNRLLESSAEKK